MLEEQIDNQSDHNVCFITQINLYLFNIIHITNMRRPLLPSQKRILETLGENIRLARLRRDLSAEQVAERADISRTTLMKVERGNEGVSMGNYFRVLAILGFEKDLINVAQDDELGRMLQDAKLYVKERASKK